MIQKKYIVSIVSCVLLLTFFLTAFLSMKLKSPTWDEVRYFGLGRYLLKNFKWDVPTSNFHPPLSYYLHSVPLMFLHLDDDIWHYSGRDIPIKLRRFPDIYRGQRLLASPGYKEDWLIQIARFPFILCGIFLGIYLFKWSRNLYGDIGGLISLLFYTLSPNIIAHTRLITPDIVLTTCMFIAIYYYWRCINESSLRNIVVATVLFGLALISKYTAILLFPIYILLAFVVYIKRRNLKDSPTSPLAFKIFHGNKNAKLLSNLCSMLMIIFIGGICILILAYGFKPVAYFKGIMFQLMFSENRLPVFLSGNHSKVGWWYYFALAFLIKTPLPTLLAFVILSIMLFIRKKALSRDEYFLIIPVLVVFIFFSIKHLCIGLRYILPVYPFLFVLLGKLYTLLRKTKGIYYFTFLFVGWYIWSSASIFPNYLAYFNGIVGGPENGYKYLVDSNLDWGQDLKQLRNYLNKKGISKVHLSYFGTADPHYYGIDYIYLPSWILIKRDNNSGSSVKGTVAVSVTNLQGVYFRNKDTFEFLRHKKPIAKIGYSIFLYEVG